MADQIQLITFYIIMGNISKILHPILHPINNFLNIKLVIFLKKIDLYLNVNYNINCVYGWTNRIIERNYPMIEDLLRLITLSPKSYDPINYKWLVRFDFRHRFSCPTRPHRIIQLRIISSPLNNPFYNI